MQHADDIPPRSRVWWRVVVPTVVLVLLGVGAGIVWQIVKDDRRRTMNGAPVTTP